MNSDTYTIDTSLTLLTQEDKPLLIEAGELVLQKESNILEGCYLTFRATLEQYQYIEQNALFNLAVEVRGVGWERGFQAGRLIEIEAKLAPHLLFPLFSRGATAASIAADLLKASMQSNSLQDEFLDELRFTENWYAMYVKQPVPLPPEFGTSSLKEGYQTQWAN